MNQPKETHSGRSWSRRLIIPLLLLLLYAYAIRVTQIDLTEPLEPKRQENLVSLIRSLARPDLFEYDSETRSLNASIRMPCPKEIKGSQVTNEGRSLLMIPNCASTTQDVVTLEGSGFPANAEGLVRWYPAGSELSRALERYKADREGNFRITFTMPDIRETVEPQRIEVVEIISRRIIGLSDTTLLALEKIVETVLMALMASTIGTLLAIPISFMAARNLMRDVKLPLAAVMLALLLTPVFAGAGWFLGQQITNLTSFMGENGLISGGGSIITMGLAWLTIKTSPTLSEPGEGNSKRRTQVTLIVTAVLGLLTLVMLAHFGLAVGSWVQENSELFAFAGNFITVLSDLFLLLLSLLLMLLGALLAISWGSRFGEQAVIHLADNTARWLTGLLTAVGATLFLFFLGYILVWFNFLGIREYSPQTLSGQLQAIGLPVAIISLAAGIGSLFAAPKRPYAIGLVIYSVTRTILNTLRSIEPLMMGFVFVVWVGLGPFAGILALTLHSVADLGKLFSEQVENIDEGPREAITATGANAVQGVVYAVLPQVTPHYIAYIFYRWDINVRMSTIIGFVGGGGIGFVLQRFLNQLQYTRASVMVIAIAVVVTLLDWVSSQVRRRII